MQGLLFTCLSFLAISIDAHCEGKQWEEQEYIETSDS